MFKLDDNFLIELGLGSLPAAEKNKMLAHIYETLEMKVGMRLAEKMSNEQLDEFESFINQNDEAGALKWLETNFPNYKQVVAEELEKLKAEIKQVSPQIIAQAASTIQPGSPVAPPQPVQAQPAYPAMPSANAQPQQYQQQPQQPMQQPAQNYGAPAGPMQPMPQQQPAVNWQSPQAPSAQQTQSMYPPAPAVNDFNAPSSYGAPAQQTYQQPAPMGAQPSYSDPYAPQNNPPQQMSNSYQQPYSAQPMDNGATSYGQPQPPAQSQQPDFSASYQMQQPQSPNSFGTAPAANDFNGPQPLSMHDSGGVPSSNMDMTPSTPIASQPSVDPVANQQQPAEPYTPPPAEPYQPPR